MLEKRLNDGLDSHIPSPAVDSHEGIDRIWLNPNSKVCCCDVDSSNFIYPR